MIKTPISALAAIVALGLVGCDRRCPWGAELAGSAPPAGTEQWCEKRDASGNLVRQGKAIVWYPGGQKQAEVMFEDGVANGPAVGWHESGQKKDEKTMAKGTEEGLAYSWFPNGQLKSETRFSGGVTMKYSERNEAGKKVFEAIKEGSATTGTGWYPTGEKLFEYSEHDDAEAVGHLLVWHKNGAKRKEVGLRGAKAEGQFTAWYPNEQKRKQGALEKGQPVGEWTSWYPDGSKRLAAVFLVADDEEKLLHIRSKNTAWWPNGSKRAEYRCVELALLGGIQVGREDCVSWTEKGARDEDCAPYQRDWRGNPSQQEDWCLDDDVSLKSQAQP